MLSCQLLVGGGGEGGWRFLVQPQLELSLVCKLVNRRTTSRSEHDLGLNEREALSVCGAMLFFSLLFRRSINLSTRLAPSFASVASVALSLVRSPTTNTGQRPRAVLKNSIQAELLWERHISIKHVLQAPRQHDCNIPAALSWWRLFLTRKYDGKCATCVSTVTLLFTRVHCLSLMCCCCAVFLQSSLNSRLVGRSFAVCAALFLARPPSSTYFFRLPIIFLASFDLSHTTNATLVLLTLYNCLRRFFASYIKVWIRSGERMTETTGMIFFIF